MSMEKHKISDFKYDNHERCCRLCMEIFKMRQKQIRITEKIENQLKGIGIELRSSTEFSRKICKSCNDQLENAGKFITKSIAIQKKLNIYVDKKSSQRVDAETVNQETESFKIYIKDEPLEFIESESAQLSSIPFESIENSQLPSPTVELKECPELKATFSSLKRKSTKSKDHEDDGSSKKNKHLKNKSSDSRVICPECGVMLSTKFNLKNHYASIHVKKKLYFCDLCDYGGTIKYHILCHMRSHINSEIRRVHKCSFCKFTSVSKQSLKVHELGRHGLNNYACHCGKTFKHKNLLKMHSNRAHGIRNHQCDECGKAFFLKKDLEEHRKMTHESDTKNEICDVCGNKFCTSTQLARHKKLHHMPKVKCEFPDCEKSFISFSLLKTHMKSHTGNRDQLCHLCEKKYFNVKDLQKHLDVVHKQTTFYCELCDYTNNRRDYLGNHLRSVHSLKIETRRIMLQRAKIVKIQV